MTERHEALLRKSQEAAAKAEQDKKDAEARALLNKAQEEGKSK